MNVPIPYLNPKQNLGDVAKYKLESESTALNLARTKFMLLTKKEAEKCKTVALRTCTSQSMTYITRGHRLRLVELFRGDKEGKKRTCRVEVSMRYVIPRAISLSSGVWAVIPEKELDLSQICRGKSTVTIRGGALVV